MRAKDSKALGSHVSLPHFVCFNPLHSGLAAFVVGRKTEVAELEDLGVTENAID